MLSSFPRAFVIASGLLVFAAIFLLLFTGCSAGVGVNPTPAPAPYYSDYRSQPLYEPHYGPQPHQVQPAPMPQRAPY